MPAQLRTAELKQPRRIDSSALPRFLRALEAKARSDGPCVTRRCWPRRLQHDGKCAPRARRDRTPPPRRAVRAPTRARRVRSRSSARRCDARPTDHVAACAARFARSSRRARVTTPPPRCSRSPDRCPRTATKARRAPSPDEPELERARVLEQRNCLHDGAARRGGPRSDLVQMNFVTPGTAITGSGAAPHTYSFGARFSSDAHAPSHVTCCPV